MPADGLARRIEAVRRFNRFYTRHIGVLNEGLLDSPYSLIEARIIYELAHHGETTATELRRELGLDGGYLSRILRRFKSAGLVGARPAPADGRQSLLSLTAEGEEAFAVLNSRSRHQVGAVLGAHSRPQQERLIGAMHTIEEILGAGPERRAAYVLRPHQPGDMGWVVHRHGVLYAAEYGWDQSFEAMVAGIVQTFIDNYDAKREACWMAEVDGAIVGSVFLVRHSEDTAQLRMLLVEPTARGLGIGKRLVDECERFARRSGYAKIRLWTNDVLVAARAIYQAAGYRLVEQEPHHSFGHDMVGEIWELALGTPRP